MIFFLVNTRVEKKNTKVIEYRWHNTINLVLDTTTDLITFKYL